MKEKIKSAVLIVLMLISIAGSALTVNYAKGNEQNKSMVNNQQMPPDMQENMSDFSENEHPRHQMKISNKKIKTNLKCLITAEKALCGK